MSGPCITRKPAKGTPSNHRHNKRGITIWFDDDDFYEISVEAAKHKISFNEMIRQLVTWGFEEYGKLEHARHRK